ncbi:Hsp70 family protein [bacterium]|nr:Hsp70 family protein [bacterium]
MDEIISQIKNEYLIDVSKDKEIMQRIKDAAEKAKIELSSATSTKIDLPFLSKTKDGTPINFSYELTRDQFEQMTKFLLDQTKDPVNQAINDAHLNVTDIDEVLLVGGSTRMPAVENLVRSLTGKEPNRTINPDEVVAIGAAVQGGLISGNVTQITLDDITPLSLGTIDYQGKNIVVIPKNTSIPVTLTQPFTTVEDNQSSIRFEVTQGESNIGKENEIIGEFVIKGIRKAPAGVPNIELTYTMNENGILHCIAHDEDTGNEISIDINTSNLTDDELNEKIKENERIRKEEQKRQEEAEKEYRNKTNFK